jgi:hypothetical protein
MRKLLINFFAVLLCVVTFTSAAQQRKRPDPVYIDATENMIVRSFIDLPVGGRVTHSINVGSPLAVHYTYDMDKGMIVAVWRGDFLNASTMWIERGDGSSRIRGKATYFGKPALMLGMLSNEQAPWVADTAGTNYKPKGYKLDDKGLPTFMYQVYGATVNDASKVSEKDGIQRQISIAGAPKGLYIRLAAAKQIVKTTDGLYVVDNNAYKIRLDDAGAQPIVRTSGDGQELLLPIQTKLTYSIIF